LPILSGGNGGASVSATDPTLSLGTTVGQVATRRRRFCVHVGHSVLVGAHGERLRGMSRQGGRCSRVPTDYPGKGVERSDFSRCSGALCDLVPAGPIRSAGY
jgi:ribosomal protein S27AE